MIEDSDPQQDIKTLLREMELYSDQVAQRLIYFNRRVRQLMKKNGIVYNSEKYGKRMEQ